MLRAGKNLGLHTQEECLAYLGRNFRIVLSVTDPGTVDRAVGQIFIEENICVHLKNGRDKFNFLCVLIEKLYALVSDEIPPENLDSLMCQEALLPGHLYLMFLREKLDELLQGMRLRIFKDGSRIKDAGKIREINYLKKLVDTQSAIGKKIEYFLATGNLRSGTGLDLMQAKGFSVIADKLNNMRFLSHFRSIHRGAYFAEMKTTTVRKLLPESWGFICPVHTPDGGPCGLLNHLAIMCKPLSRPVLSEEHLIDFIKICSEIGMHATINNLNIVYPPNALHVLLNGRVIGYINEGKAATDFVKSLKMLKIT